MYGSARSGAKAYAKVGLETGISAASPQKLIVMLYEGAELSLRMAIQHMREGDIEKKSADIAKAGAIIREGLRSALDKENGGEIAEQLDALYAYMDEKIFAAHVSNKPEPLEEVLGLLGELREAWEQVASRQGALA